MRHITKKIVSFIPEEEIDPHALQQLHNIASLPFIFKHISVMPDCHVGKGATVGSVIATKGAIIPAAVGVDIGCGMAARRTSLTASDLPDTLTPILDGIEKTIPTGRGKNQRVCDDAAVFARELSDKTEHPAESWQQQLGSLGGGNHFIELSLDEHDNVWIVLHSGSRGIGNQLAQKHIKIAQKLMDDFFIPLEDRDLAYLPQNTPEFDAYMADLLWAQDFALSNRKIMLRRVEAVMQSHFPEIQFLDNINCHHNFSQMENHFNENIWVTRKGAIQMNEGMFGIIPGSMGTRTYIVEGLGNNMAFRSAPHGAGRRFSRTEARKRFTPDDLRRSMEGIEYRHRESILDEIPEAYKDIDQVMEYSKDLVSVKAVLRQILSVKGD